jgi:hypothetical protein
MIEQTLFSLGPAAPCDPGKTGGLDVAVDPTFATTTRIQLDESSWVDHVQGWLRGDEELMVVLMAEAAWEQRSRWMYTRRLEEPRLTAEFLHRHPRR